MLRDEYRYDKTSTDIANLTRNDPNLENVATSIFLNLISLEKSVIKMVANEEDLDNNFKKGIIIGAIFHYFLFWLLVSIFRTISSRPGAVPEEWIRKTEEELNSYFLFEQRLIKRIKKEQRLSNKKSNLNSKKNNEFICNYIEYFQIQI